MNRWQPALMAVTALGLSGALHAAGLVRFAPAPVAVAQGGEAQAAPLLGDSFADMAEGMARPVVAAAVPALASPPEALAPVTADPASQAVPLAQISPLPQLAALAPLASRIPVSPPAVDPARPVAPPVAQTTRPKEILTPDEALPKTPPKARPKARPVPAASPPPSTAGNANRTARKGTAQGTDRGKSTTAAAAASPAPGDGGSTRAAASYGREVMARIARTRKPRSTERGRAVVGFVIADSGAVARVSILRSSGSASLDAQAMDHIRRAAPFAPPPTGAPRSLSVEFIGR